MAALKPTTCKEAIARWEKQKGEVAADATVIELQFQWPPIEKMDGALSTLVSCDCALDIMEFVRICTDEDLRRAIFVWKLSLSSNMIDKIAGIAGMRSLKILSLGRNYLRSISGIETVADTLEELWISYNNIDKLKGIGAMKKLRVFYIANNMIKEWAEFNRLQDCPALRDLVFIGNPLYDNQTDVDTWRTQACNRLQQINKLDGIPIVRD